MKKKCRNRRKPFRPVSHSKLRETRILSGLSKEKTAEMLHVTYRTLHNWESGRVQVPYAAFKLLHILTGYELPSDAWRGWKFSGEVLLVTRGQKIHCGRFKLPFTYFCNGPAMAARTEGKTQIRITSRKIKFAALCPAKKWEEKKFVHRLVTLVRSLTN